jgi:hypothetical protein
MFSTVTAAGILQRGKGIRLAPLPSPPIPKGKNLKLGRVSAFCIGTP